MFAWVYVCVCIHVCVRVCWGVIFAASAQELNVNTNENVISHQYESPLHLESVGDVVAVFDGLEGHAQAEHDACVAGDDDDGRDGQVHGEHADHEGDTVGDVPHVGPGQRAGQAEGLGPVLAPASEREGGPQQGVEPCAHHQQLHVPLAHPLLWGNTSQDGTWIWNKVHTHLIYTGILILYIYNI